MPAVERNAIDPDLNARLLPEIPARLFRMALGAQALQVPVLVRATLEQRHDVIELGGWPDAPGGPTGGAQRISTQNPLAQALQRSPSRALHDHETQTASALAGRRGNPSNLPE